MINDFPKELGIRDEEQSKLLAADLEARLLKLKRDIYISNNLTEEEIAGIKQLCAENELLSKFYYEVALKMIAYKQTGALDKIEKPDLTDDERSMINDFPKELGIRDEEQGKLLVADLEARLLAYKKAIYESMNPPAPEYSLTDEEIRGIEALTKEMKELDGMAEKLKAAMLEYKKSGALENIKDPAVTDADKQAIMETLVAMGVDKGAVEGVTEKLAQKLMAYREAIIVATGKK